VIAWGALRGKMDAMQKRVLALLNCCFKRSDI
jgi:hypothetical protein